MAEPIKLTVTAKDDASKTLDEVKAKGQALDREKVVVEVTAQDAEAKAVLESDAAQVAALDAETPVITVTAVDEAAPVLEADAALAASLSGTPVVIETAVVGTAAEGLAAVDTAAVGAAGSVTALTAAEGGLTAATGAADASLVTEAPAMGAVTAEATRLEVATTAAAAAQVALGAAGDFVANVFGTAYVNAIDAGATDTEALAAAEGTLAAALAAMTAQLDLSTAAFTGNAAAAAADTAATEADTVAKVANSGASTGLLGSLKGISSTLTETVGTFAPVAGVAAAVGLVVEKVAGSFEKLALAAKNFSTASGTSIEDASRWVEVSNDLGVSADAVQGAIFRVNREAASGKLDQYGLQAHDASGRFVELIQKISAIPDASARAQAAFNVFGKSAQSLTPLFTNIESLPDRLNEVGDAQIIHEDQAQQVRQFDDDLDTLSDDAHALGIELGQLAVPMLDSLAKIVGPVADFLALVAKARDDLQKKPGTNWLEGTLAVLTSTGPELGKRIVGIFSDTSDAADKVDSSGRKVGDTFERWHQTFVVLSHSVENVTGKTKEQVGWIIEADKRTQELTDSTGDYTKANEDLATALIGVSAAADKGTDSQKAMNSTFGEAVNANFATHDAYGKVEDGIDGVIGVLNKAGPEFRKTGDHVTTFTKTGRDLLGHLHTLGSAIGQDLGQTLKDSGGDYDQVRQKAADYREELTQEALKAGASKDSIQGMIEMMNLTPEQVETTIKLSKEEEARQKLLLLQSAIGALPKDTQLKIASQIEAGDYTGAVKTAQDYATDHPVDSQLDLKTALADTAYDNWAKTHGTTTVDMGVNTAPASAGAAAFRAEEEGHPIIIPGRINFEGGVGTTPYGPRNPLIKMSGGPINESGVYDVGEAGRERVFLPRGANVMTAGALMTAEAGGSGLTHIINVNVRVDPTVSLSQAGSKIADALEAYYRSSGSRRAYAPAA